MEPYKSRKKEEARKNHCSKAKKFDSHYSKTKHGIVNIYSLKHSPFAFFFQVSSYFFSNLCLFFCVYIPVNLLTLIDNFSIAAHEIMTKLFSTYHQRVYSFVKWDKAYFCWHKIMNESTRLWIEERLGQVRAISLPWLISLTAVYSLIFVMGILGNMATILVILRFKYMRSVTNMYIFNLAITDFLSLFIGKSSNGN